MPTPPTFITDVETVFNTNTGPKTSPSFSGLNGDWMIFAVAAANDESTSGVTFTVSSGESVTEHGESAGTQGSDTWIEVASSQMTADRTNITVQAAEQTSITINWGFNTSVWRASDGIGNTGYAANLNANWSSNFTTSFDNSALVVIISDWNVQDAPSRVYRQINGASPTEMAYSFDSTDHTVFVIRYADCGTAGTKALGFSSGGPAGSRCTYGAIEIRGSSLAADQGNKIIPWSRRPTRLQMPLPPWYLPIPYADQSGVAVDQRFISASGVLGVGADSSALKRSTPASSGIVGLVGVDQARKIIAPSGNGALGVHAQSTSKKVMSRSADGSLGIHAASTSKKVMSRSADGSLGLGAQSTAVHRLSPSLNGALGISPRSTPIHRATPSLNGAMGISPRVSAFKRSTPSLNGAFGIAGVDQALKRSSPSLNGAFGIGGVALRIQVAVITATGAFGLVGLASAKKINSISVSGNLGIAPVDQARKLISRSASGNLGIAGISSPIKVIKPSGNSPFGVSSWFVHVPQAFISARGTFGLTSTSTGLRKRSTPLSSGDLGLHTRNTGYTKIAKPSASGVFAITGTDLARKIISTNARGTIGILTSVLTFNPEAPTDLYATIGTAVFPPLAHGGTASKINPESVSGSPDTAMIKSGGHPDVPTAGRGTGG